MSRRKQARPNRLGEEEDAAMDLQMDKQIIAQEENHEQKSIHSFNGKFFCNNISCWPLKYFKNIYM